MSEIRVAVFDTDRGAAPRFVEVFILPFEPRDIVMNKRSVYDKIRDEVRARGRKVRSIDPVARGEYEIAVYLAEQAAEQRLRRKPVRRAGPHGGKIPGRRA